MARLGHQGYISAGTPTTPVNMQSAIGAPANLQSSAGQIRSDLADITQGRITLAALDFIIIAMVLFYWRTHGIQGGG